MCLKILTVSLLYAFVFDANIQTTHGLTREKTFRDVVLTPEQIRADFFSPDRCAFLRGASSKTEKEAADQRCHAAHMHFEKLSEEQRSRCPLTKKPECRKLSTGERACTVLIPGKKRAWYHKIFFRGKTVSLHTCI